MVREAFNLPGFPKRVHSSRELPLNQIEILSYYVINKIIILLRLLRSLRSNENVVYQCEIETRSPANSRYDTNYTLDKPTVEVESEIVRLFIFYLLNHLDHCYSRWESDST